MTWRAPAPPGAPAARPAAAPGGDRRPGGRTPGTPSAHAVREDPVRDALDPKLR
ncbi:hypothetical protein [Streptomyces sp. NPDC003832]